MIAAASSTIGGVVWRWSRLTTPHHVTPMGAARIMADQEPTTRELQTICPVCGQTRIIIDRRQRGKRCHPCGMLAKRERFSGGLSRCAQTKYHQSLYESACPDCGRVAVVGKRDVGNCCRPCANKKRKTHGLSSQDAPHPLYRILKSAEARCRYPATKDYQWYGGRGISVCEEWRRDPAAFVSWAIANGWRRGLDIDRIDVDGNYCPENCRFVSHAVNCQNKRIHKR